MFWLQDANTACSLSLEEELSPISAHDPPQTGDALYHSIDAWLGSQNIVGAQVEDLQQEFFSEKRAKVMRLAKALKNGKEPRKAEKGFVFNWDTNKLRNRRKQRIQKLPLNTEAPKEMLPTNTKKPIVFTL